jgi:hypothetical protein
MSALRIAITAAKLALAWLGTISTLIAIDQLAGRF